MLVMKQATAHYLNKILMAFPFVAKCSQHSRASASAMTKPVICSEARKDNNDLPAGLALLQGIDSSRIRVLSKST